MRDKFNKLLIFLGIIPDGFEKCADCGGIVPKYLHDLDNEDEHYLAHGENCLYRNAARITRQTSFDYGFRGERPKW